ncbi:MAG: arginase [Planctomycetota bacterium]|nr:arginase [Planctomycetota bacterium]
MTSRKRSAALISVHMDLGAGRRGVDMGPSAIRVAGLSQRIRDLGWRVRESGSVVVAEAESTNVGRKNARYLDEVLDVCTRLRDLTLEVRKEGCFPIVLGGDHSIAMGSVSGQALHHREREESIGLLWVDAHTDMNLPDTSPSGNIHGMPLSHLIGKGIPALRKLAGTHAAVRPENVALLGIRSVDRTERAVVKESGVRVYTMTEIDERGLATCMKEALAIVNDGTTGFHLSFDLDGVDPRVAPGVGTAVFGGLTYREAHLICEACARTSRLLGMDMVELNPTLDDRNATGELAVELILSALGQTIL